MKHIYSSVHLRLIVLTIAVFILCTDTFVYGKEKLSDQNQLPTQETTTVNPSPSLTPLETPASQKEEPATRMTGFTLLKKVQHAQIEAAQTSFAGAPIPTSISEVAIYQLSYEIKGKDGTWQPTTAKVFVPTTVSTTGKNYPLFVFGSGTTGMADKCAPSLENMAVENLGNYENHMIAQAAAGYISVFPDYEGFHSGATQAYFISESEAKVLLGAIVNLRELQPSKPELQVGDLNSVFLAGYSQGGHAALSTAQQWQKLPTEVKLKGIIQFAGAADVEALFLESPWLASYLVDSYTQYYGSDLDSREVLQDRWLIPLVQNNAELCVNAAYKFYPRVPGKIYSPSFLDAIETHTWPSRLANWQKAIQRNIPLSNIPDVPHLSIQGESDPIVTAKAQRANVKKLCEQDLHVAYREYQGVNHFQIRQVSFTATNEWMSSVLAGHPVPSDCP